MNAGDAEDYNNHNNKMHGTYGGGRNRRIALYGGIGVDPI
jgi:hypothetical protein